MPLVRLPNRKDSEVLVTGTQMAVTVHQHSVQLVAHGGSWGDIAGILHKTPVHFTTYLCEHCHLFRGQMSHRSHNIILQKEGDRAGVESP